MYNKDILGWMVEAELAVIEKIAAMVPKNGTIVEVGSMFGRSTFCWAASCDPSVTVYAIDTFLESYCVTHDISDDICEELNFPKSNVSYNLHEEFLKNTNSFTNLVNIRGESPREIEWDSNKKIDLLFLDTSHTNPNDWDNLEFYMQFLNKGAIICGHDYGENFKDVLDNVNKLEKIYNTKVILFSGTLLWMITTDHEKTT